MLTNSPFSENSSIEQKHLCEVSIQSETTDKHSSTTIPAVHLPKKRGRPATGRKVLICPYEACNGKKFRDLYNLRSHLKTHVRNS